MLLSATLLVKIPPKGSPLTARLGLSIGQTPVFPFPVLAGSSGETRQNKRKPK
jgi:hypothetical protein